MARRNKNDRNAIAAKRAEYRREASERIKHNEAVFESNEEFIPKMEKELELNTRWFDAQIGLNRLKVSDLRVLNPTWSFEQTEKFSDFNKELLEIEFERLTQQRLDSVQKLEIEIETRREQQTRIVIENDELRDKIKSLDEGKFEILD